MDFANWLEANAAYEYKRLGGAIADYIDAIFSHLENEGLTAERALQMVMHAYADDIVALGDPTYQSQLVQWTKRLCEKFAEEGSFSFVSPNS